MPNSQHHTHSESMSSKILFVVAEVAVVGLERTYFPVLEHTIGGIEICVTVNSSSVNCPIEFPFAVTLTAIDGTAGM